MQTPKKSSNKIGPSEARSKTSPMTSPSPRKKITTGLESPSVTMPAVKTLNTKSPKMVERRSPRSPASEKKRLDKMSELETRLSKLQEDLNKTKDQLASCESGKRKAQQEAEESKKQLVALKEELEDSKRQLQEFSESEDDRIQELRKIGQQRDKAWQSELEAVQKQHSADSSALIAAMNEIHRLRMQLDMVANTESGKAKQTEIANSGLDQMKIELSESFSAIETLRAQLMESDKTEVEYQETINETHMQLVIANATIDTLRSNGQKLMDSFNYIFSELEELKTRVQSLEDVVAKLQSCDQIPNPCPTLPSLASDANTSTTELNSLTLEVSQLKSALEEAEMRCNEEHAKYKMQFQSACDALQRTKTESDPGEPGSLSDIKRTNAESPKSKANLNEQETQLQDLDASNGRAASEKMIQEYNEKSNSLSNVGNSLEDVTMLKTVLVAKDNELQSILEENRLLKLMVKEKETEGIESHESAVAEVGDERMKLRAEADDDSWNTVKVAELLEASQASMSEMEVELRRLRVQAVQWQKAAEAAAAILAASEKDGRLVERTGSLDSDCNAKMRSSPFYDEIEDESPKKKNMLKRFGVLWKKGQK